MCWEWVITVLGYFSVFGLKYFYFFAITFVPLNYPILVSKGTSASRGGRYVVSNHLEYQRRVSAWCSQGKTTLPPNPGEFTSDNQRPITCVNTLYQWLTSCLLGPANKHLETHGLISVCTLFEQIQGLFKNTFPIFKGLHSAQKKSLKSMFF